MASHLTKLLRRLATAGIEPRFEVCMVHTTPHARVLSDDGPHKITYGKWVPGDSPETAIGAAVEAALAEHRKRDLGAKHERMAAS